MKEISHLAPLPSGREMLQTSSSVLQTFSETFVDAVEASQTTFDTTVDVVDAVETLSKLSETLYDVRDTVEPAANVVFSSTLKSSRN